MSNQGLAGKALRERGLRAERQYETRRGGEMDLALLCVLGNLGITLEDTGAERVALSVGSRDRDQSRTAQRGTGD